MERVILNLTEYGGIIMILAFTVNIVVQLTKGYIGIPTSILAIIVAVMVVTGVVFAGASFGYVELSFGVIILGFLASFLIAFIAMFGFDKFKALWERFKAGENINRE